MQTAFVKAMSHGVLIIGLAALLSACSTPPPAPVPLTPEERMQRDRSLGSDLSRQFESHFKIKQDREVQVYLRGVAQSLADASPAIQGASVGVLVIQDHGGLWRSFGFPGYRMYISAGLLKGSEYENELAAIIAIEMGHILLQHPVMGLRQEFGTGQAPLVTNGSSRPQPPGPEEYDSLKGLFADRNNVRAIDYFGPTGMFSYPDEFYLDAAEAAVGLLYRAGYDPRGLVSLWERYKANLERSPYDARLLEKLLEKTRRVIALYSPLRNPIVRSQAFMSIQKRIRGL